jgi:hypothetical protein
VYPSRMGSSTSFGVNCVVFVSKRILFAHMRAFLNKIMHSLQKRVRAMSCWNGSMQGTTSLPYGFTGRWPITTQKTWKSRMRIRADVRIFEQNTVHPTHLECCALLMHCLWGLTLAWGLGDRTYIMGLTTHFMTRGSPSD